MQHVDQTARPVAGPLSHEMFEAQVRIAPDRPAVRHQDRVWTYRQLDRAAERVAGLIRHGAAGPGATVAVCLPRGFALVAAAVGAFRAGVAYLPCDPAHPTRRIRRTLATAGVPLVLTTRELADVLAGDGVRSVVVDTVDGDTPVEAVPPTPVEPEDVAYVVYTSGSTGTPKGVMIEHHSLAAFVRWDRDAWGLGPQDRIALIASPSFDASMWDIWPTLAAGACLCVADRDVVLADGGLRDWIVAEQVTVLFVTPALGQPLIKANWPSGTALRYLLIGGDRLQIRPGPGLPFTVTNNYGPTETTIIVTSGPVEPTGSDSARTSEPPSIGRPLAYAEIHILDPELRPVAPGELGELYLGGPGVGQGYLRRPGLTADRFVPDPFATRPGARLYRSGDLGRWLPDGRIAFIGRTDDQVKIRGNRVEPGEAAVALARHPDVSTAHVAVVAGDDGQPELVAYLAAREPAAPPTPAALRRFLDESLPAYLVPRRYVTLAQLPLNPNGKVDRGQLPPPGPEHAAGPVASFVPPGTTLERRIAALWGEALKVDRVGLEDSFFDLGGHSMLLAQVHRRLTHELGYRVPLVSFFEHPTVRSLARHLAAASAPDGAPAGPGQQPAPAVPEPVPAVERGGGPARMRRAAALRRQAAAEVATEGREGRS